ncbi:MAG TPA: tetratricopeptide repeat protein [Bryobacteraceae bacterium]|nr:tetratricopeptide repeat protein [Bryobacteraceae bacterium]
MPRPQGEGLIAKSSRPDLRPYLKRESVIVALLSTLAVLGFSAVSGLSSLYHRQQASLGSQWFARGTRDLMERRFEPAIAAFRTALVYSRDNYSYQLNLAEALLGENRAEEASAYLSNLWDRQPENGIVNLELARIAARKGESDQALRYYHNAIYATWPADRPTARQDARLELIDYLLRTGDKVQARPELIALAANLGDDPAREAQIAGLFLKIQDYPDALHSYRLSLEASRANPAALAGAGRAAFELRQYRDARQYLEAAIAAGSREPDVPAMLHTADLVLRLDPFRRQLPADARTMLVIEAYAAAGSRLQACAAPAASGTQPRALENLSKDWTGMKPRITARHLRRDPDLAESAMELVFRIERQAGSACPHTATDDALLLIGKLHEPD